MKKEDLQEKILQKQNSEMAAKLHWYRRENQELKNKNQELDLWVQNLSQVLSGVSGAWQTILNLQESLYTLMKKKTEMKDKTVLSKYIAHFKAFSDIVENLAQKIKNTGHSDQATLDAKTRLTSFVRNYEMFFKQFVDTYFKFNEQYTQWLSDIQKKPEIQQINRTISTKELENRQKIKQFQAFIIQFKENFKIYQAYNQHALMDGILAKKEEQINNLKQINCRQARKLRIMMDYNIESVNSLLENIDDPSYFECYCGGSQIKYFKTVWQQALKNLQKKKSKQLENGDQNRDQTGEDKVKRQELNTLEIQKNRLIERNTLLLDKIQKLKVQNRLTQEIVLKSNSYLLLKQQCQNLINYTNDLLGRLKKQSEYIMEIQNNREKQLKQLKRKYEKMMNGNSFTQLENPSLIKTKTIQVFKTDLVKSVSELKQSYLLLTQKQNIGEQIIIKMKSTIQSLKKDNEDLNRRLNDHHISEINKVQKIQFRHQKFTQIQQKLNNFLKDSQIDSSFLQSWKQFIFYFKSRDKKIKQLQSSIRKKDRQLIQKQKVTQLLNNSLGQTQKLYLSIKKKVDQLQQFDTKVQKQLIKILQQNYNLKIQSQQQKTMLNLRLKAQTDARNKLQQKVRLFQKIQQQILQVKNYQNKIKQNYFTWITQKNIQIQKLKLDINQKLVLINNLKDQIQQKDKTLLRLNTQKQNLKSQISQMQIRLKNISQKCQYEEIKKQLIYYKNRVMCSCTGDRQRQVVLKTCPHLFCKKCIQDSTNNRNRKCPICATKFTKSDIHQIKLI